MKKIKLIVWDLDGTLWEGSVFYKDDKIDDLISYNNDFNITLSSYNINELKEDVEKQNKRITALESFKIKAISVVATVQTAVIFYCKFLFNNSGGK